MERRRLVRFVVGPEGLLVPDIAGRLPGRGLWVKADRAALERAVAKRLFGRAAKAPLKVPDGLADLVAALLARRCLDLLGLARGAGLVAAGFEQVRERFARREPAALLAARDGALEGRGRLSRLWPEAPRVEIFASEELSLSLGRENVIHAALAPGGLTERFLAEVERLRGIRHDGGEPPP